VLRIVYKGTDPNTTLALGLMFHPTNFRSHKNLHLNNTELS